MFYSHELLTSQEYGVATVWLVATVGPKSNLKKVNRKAILEVNVPKACETILAPKAPIALRLQSNLLYGVSRVYSQQCGYVLADAQTAQNNMRTLLKVIRTAPLDLSAGEARPAQLMIENDPALVVNLEFAGLEMDLSGLDLSSEASSGPKSIWSQYSQQSSQSSHHERETPPPALVIPTSEDSVGADIGGFASLVEDGSSVLRGRALGGVELLSDEEGFLRDADFEFDAEGNVIELGTEERERRRTPAGVRGRPTADSSASGRVRREHEEGLRSFAELEFDRSRDFDIDMPPIGDDYDIPLPEAEPFPEMVPTVASGAGFLKSSSEIPEEEEPSSESAAAPLRPKRRAPKVLAQDEIQELPNSNLTRWNNEYLDNMASHSRSRQHYKMSAQAKKNATFWVIGAGIGGVGSGIGMSKLDAPLDMFSGKKLMETLTGIGTAAAGRKRSRSVGEEGQSSESEVRRVRTREDDGEQIGLGENQGLNDYGMMAVIDDDGLEVGREAQPALADVSSQMPWNISASIRGSRHGSSVARGRGFPSSIGDFPTSAGGPSSARGIEGGPPGSLSRRASRLASASPLVGRGRERYSSLEIPGHADDDDLPGDRLVSDDQLASEDFQGFGTQSTAQSQWMRASLDQESLNFLNHVKEELNNKPPPEDEDEDLLAGDGALRRSIKFDELLPPTVYSKQVAAHALHHVLTLATKSLIDVQQDEGYGPIFLSVAVGA